MKSLHSSKKNINYINEKLRSSVKLNTIEGKHDNYIFWAEWSFLH